MWHSNTWAIPGKKGRREPMNIIVSSTCCGVREICELRAHATPEEALKAFMKTCFSDRGNYIGSNIYLFSGVKRFTKNYVAGLKPVIATYEAVVGWSPDQ